MRVCISNYNLKNNKMNNIKIAHLSDIHFDIKYNEKRLFNIIDKLKKYELDYICITGDLFDNNKTYLDDRVIIKFQEFMFNLNNIAKVIVTLGNHEMEYRSKYDITNYKILVEKFKKEKNIIFLENRTYIDNNVCFIGFNPSDVYYANKEKNINLLIQEFNNNNFNINSYYYNILLIHTPKNLLSNKLFEKIPDLKKINLILAGHTHGGMMPIKIKGHFGIISPGKKLFPKLVRGHIIKNNVSLIICSGIVRLSNSTYFLKYFNDIYAAHINIINITN